MIYDSVSFDGDYLRFPEHDNRAAIQHAEGE